MNKHIFETDYSADWPRWFEIFKDIKDHHINFSSDKKLDKIQEEIIINQDAALAYFFSCDFKYKTYKMQEVILKKKEPKYALLFAQHIPHADIQALQNLVLNSDHKDKIKYICKFACFVAGADKKKLENIIAKEVSKQPYKKARWAHMFIKNVPGANIDKFKNSILKSRKPRYLFELAKHVDSRREISQIENIIIKLQSYTYIRLLAQKISAANVSKLEQAVLDTGNGKEIKKFARAVKKSKIRNLSILF